MAEETRLRMAEKAENEAAIADAKDAQAAVAQAVVVLEEFYARAGDATALVQKKKKQAPPAIFDSPYKGMQAEKGGIIGLLEVVQSDFARLEAATSSDEASAQKAYDDFMTDSKVDKAQKQKDIRKNIKQWSKKYDAIDDQAKEAARQAFKREREEKTNAFNTVLDRLNEWKAEQIQDFECRPTWRYDDTEDVGWPTGGRRRGGDRLIDYGVPAGSGGITVVYHNPLSRGSAQECSPAVESFLVNSKISRVFSGHQPHGESPSIVRQPRSGILFLTCDTSYSAPKAPTDAAPTFERSSLTFKEWVVSEHADNRGQAVTMVRIEGDAVCVEGRLSDGSKHRCVLHDDPSQDEFPDALVGRQLESGAWV